MSYRIPLDANVIAYWGFDEALETDNAMDATANGIHLTVSGSNGAIPGRVGNSRIFSAAGSYASAASSALRLTGDLTLMAWVQLYSYSSTGSQLRTIMFCGGPAATDGVLYSLSVTGAGALSYRHTAAAGEVVATTAAGVLRTGQLYFVVARRITSGGSQNIEFYIDNVLKPAVTVTVAGVAQALPIPPPKVNAGAIFSAGRSQHETDFAYWDGPLDEMTVHDVARPLHSYLLDAYYRVAVRAGTTKLSVMDTVVAVSSAEMGAGVRWWCYERNKDLFVVRESPFGRFGSETKLTTVPNSSSAFTGKPELIYDAATDTLYVFFISGSRVFKLTAGSTDVPATINMPYTTDAGSILKSVDHVEGGRLGDGGGQRQLTSDDISMIDRAPIKFSGGDFAIENRLGESGGFKTPEVGLNTPHVPTIVFSTLSGYGFGVVVGPADSQVGGYRVYRVVAGVAVPMTTPVQVNAWRVFVPIVTRAYGTRYYAEALTLGGRSSGVVSNVIIDLFSELQLLPLGDSLVLGRDGDGQDSGEFGDGGGMRVLQEFDVTYFNSTSLKVTVLDPDVSSLGSGGGQSGSVTQASRTVMF